MQGGGGQSTTPGKKKTMSITVRSIISDQSVVYITFITPYTLADRKTLMIWILVQRMNVYINTLKI